MSQSDAGKTDKRRPCFVSDTELTLRWGLVQGRINRKTFDKKMKKLKGKNNE